MEIHSVFFVVVVEINTLENIFNFPSATKAENVHHLLERNSTATKNGEPKIQNSGYFEAAGKE